MIHKLLATTALVTLLASGAHAQTATSPDPAAAPATEPATENAAPVAPVARADGSLAANIIGEDVYNGSGDDAESIGKVSDIVFDKDGQAKSVVIGVGGFLGVGSKNVAFDYDKMQWAEKNGDRWLVAETSKDALTALPEFDDTPYEPAPAPQASGDTGMAPATAPATTAMAPADNSSATAPAGDAAQPAAPADTASADTTAAPTPRADGSLASNIIGENVYNGSGDDAENIGNVKDIVLSKAGKAEQFVIGVGGFLGVGAKNVAFDYDKAEWSEKNGDRWLVVQGTKDELKGLPAFDRKAYDPAPATTAAGGDTPAMVTPATDTAANQPADDASAPAATDQTAEAPAVNSGSGTDATQTAAIDKSTLTEVPSDKISADNLIGTTVYGADDANVGEIGDVVLSTDNGIDAVVVDVGGFLGVGEKPVAIGMDSLKFMADKDGNQYLYTNFTKDQLEAQAAYDKGSYAEKRDEQRMILQ
jgi:sporulation protein YlmC with PRC-barrel domain